MSSNERNSISSSSNKAKSQLGRVTSYPITISSNRLNRPTSSLINISNPTMKKKTNYSAKTIKRLGSVISKFMTTKVLKNICSDSGECLAFGRQTNTIRKYFNNFTNFDFVESPITRIGKPSKNGFVNEIKYVRDKYTSYSILKSSASIYSDNLAYEYNVGLFINDQCSRFSCFLQTYGMYYYRNQTYWNYLKNTKSITESAARVANIEDVLKTSLIYESNPNINYNKACKNSIHIAILVQHISNAISFFDIIKKINKTDTDIWNILLILYQVYFPLCALDNAYTHYDLHSDNVLLYRLSSDKYIEYNYHFRDGRTIVFYSKYIAKIIDYGRSYFYKSDTDNSSIIATKLCTLFECNRPVSKKLQKCGDMSGFHWLYNAPNPYYVHSYMPNRSFDLRLLKTLEIYDGESQGNNELRNTRIFKELFEKLVFTGPDGFGTPEKASDSSGKINNIHDLLSMLTDEIVNNPAPLPTLSSSTIIGKFDIYEINRPMVYTKNNSTI